MKRILAFFGLSLWSILACAGGDYWVLIDTQASSLQVMQGQAIEQQFADISVGRYGVTHNKKRHDNQTPLGEFRITHVTRDTRFRLFIGLSYPNLAHARFAREQGWLAERDWQRIVRAERQQLPPPQDTPLGGYIGIHGLGEGDPMVHEQFNWTNGCIALTNEQIETLAHYIAVGARVVIR